jgi:hypothetical protein
LIGCVSYQFPGDDAVHFTKFAYVVNWEGHRAYPYDLSTVPITEVKMYPLTTKGYFGAD